MYAQLQGDGLVDDVTMVWGLTDVEGNINAAKYIDIVDLWPVIAQHFTHKPYVNMDGNAPVHRANSVKAFMTNNEINTPT